VLVVGDLNADLILRAPQEEALRPVMGTEKLIDDATLTLGGSAANTACGLVRLGVPATLVACIGNDPLGDLLLDLVGRHGVDPGGVVQHPSAKTGISTALSTPHDRGFLTYLGALVELRAEDLPARLLERARHLHTTSYFMLAGLRPGLPELLATAKRHGLTASLDTGFDPAQRWTGLDELWPYLDVFLPNEVEALAITRARTVEQAAALLAQRVRCVVVKRGPDGCLAACHGRIERVGAPEVPVADTTGAGDAFNAGFLAGWLEGLPLQRCLALGVACGTLSVMQLGATAGQPSREQAEEFVRRYLV
jgi:sugar/nucleoside kinase (ribokinase family)